MSYQEIYRRSLEDPEGFWGEAAQALHWDKPWDKVLDASARPFYRWFAGGMINSGGSVNHFASHIVREAMRLELLDAHVTKLRREYRARVEAMDRALESEFGSQAEWLTPAGGYFFWVRFSGRTDVAALREPARERQTGFQPGQVFSVNDRFANCLRLSFAHYGTDDIAEGIRRLRPLFD